MIKISFYKVENYYEFRVEVAKLKVKSFLMAFTLTMESFETSDFNSEHFTTVPLFPNKRPIVSIKSCVSSRVKGVCCPNCLKIERA